MKWNKIKVVAEVGTQFGIVSDKDGELVLALKQPGKDWAHNIVPTAGQNEILEGATSYVVFEEKPCCGGQCKRLNNELN